MSFGKLSIISVPEFVRFLILSKEIIYKERVRTGGASCSWFDTIARNKKIASYALTVNTCKQIIPKRTHHKLLSIRQQLLSDPTFGHLPTTRMCLPLLWQGQSEIILKIYKNNFFSRKGHCTNCLQSGSNCLVTQLSVNYNRIHCFSHKKKRI